MWMNCSNSLTLTDGIGSDTCDGSFDSQHIKIQYEVCDPFITCRIKRGESGGWEFVEWVLGAAGAGSGAQG